MLPGSDFQATLPGRLLSLPRPVTPRAARPPQAIVSQQPARLDLAALEGWADSDPRPSPIGGPALHDTTPGTSAVHDLLQQLQAEREQVRAGYRALMSHPGMGLTQFCLSLFPSPHPAVALTHPSPSLSSSPRCLRCGRTWPRRAGTSRAATARAGSWRVQPRR